jgi:signal transduction histidine kinase
LAGIALQWTWLRGHATSGYRGPDRRRAAVVAAPTSRTLALALGVFVVLTVAVALAAAGLGPSTAPTTARDLQWVTASTAMLAAVAAAVYAMRWRLVGEAAALWTAGGLLVYGATAIAFPAILQSLNPASADAATWAGVLRPASVFVVIVLLALAAGAPMVDSTLTPRRLVVVATSAGALGMAGAAASKAFRLVLGPAIGEPPRSGAMALGQVGIAIVWLALGSVFLHQALRRGRMSSAWLGIMLLALAEARLAVGISVTRGSSWMVASQAFRVIGAAAALAGAVRGLQQAFVEQRAHLVDSLIELESARARERAAEASAEERAHDLRAALAGIGGAAVTLERYHDTLTAEERSMLAGAVSAEINRLQSIVGRVRREPEVFGVAGALHPILVCAASQGAGVDVDLPSDLLVVGRSDDLAEAMQNLVDNARRYAPGSTVEVRGERRGLQVEVRVEDRGPGVPLAERERIFERGWRGRSDVDGSGLGLHVAARLVRDMGGDIRVEERPGGGASFVLTLLAGTEGADQ